MEKYDPIQLTLIVDVALLLFIIAFSIFRNQLMLFQFKRGAYSAVIARAQKLFLRDKEESDKEPQNEKKRNLVERDSLLLAISYFSVKKYDHFLYHINFLTDKTFEESKQIWLFIYSIVVLKNIEKAEEHYEKFNSLPVLQSSPPVKPFLKALLWYEQGQTDDAYPVLEESAKKIQMPILRNISNEYLSKYSR